MLTEEEKKKYGNSKINLFKINKKMKKNNHVLFDNEFTGATQMFHFCLLQGSFSTLLTPFFYLLLVLYIELAP